jgi:hypothetical protein
LLIVQDGVVNTTYNAASYARDTTYNAAAYARDTTYNAGVFNIDIRPQSRKRPSTLVLQSRMEQFT